MGFLMADITLDDLTAGRGYEHWATQTQMASLIEQTKDIPRIAGFFQALGSTSKKETDISKAILNAARQNLAANQRGNQADAKGRAEDKRRSAASASFMSRQDVGNKTGHHPHLHQRCSQKN